MSGRASGADRVALRGQGTDGLLNSLFFMEFNAQSAFCQFPVVVDPDILDTHVVGGQQGGDGGNGAGPVCDIQSQDMFGLDRAAGSFDKGLSVFSC